jgi:DNA polymerase-3 subunit epsilon
LDTETTGLNPKGGDEIVSLAAVRIVKQRVLQGEVFDRLVNPKRKIPVESIRIHGIDDQVVEAKPDITEILPCFYNYAKDTVLIAHQADFDLAMFRAKQEQTRIKFDNPVLDTMLLSSFVHPNQTDHSLEAIAHRLGVQVQGRHTALGDAWTAANIFLGLIPLLIDKGIGTLNQAVWACKGKGRVV